jgi:hypothetical protein
MNPYIPRNRSTYSATRQTQKIPARFPARAHFVNFNFLNSLICLFASSATTTSDVLNVGMMGYAPLDAGVRVNRYRWR